MKTPSPPEPLDLNQLISLPQEKLLNSLLQWLADCETFLISATPEEVSQHQQLFLANFLNLLNLPTPVLGHTLRHCLGRCFVEIYNRGDRKTLFDAVSTLLNRVNQFKADKDLKQKGAIIFCLGEILAVASDSVMQLVPEVVSGLNKIIRNSHFETGIRSIALDTLRKAFIKYGQIKEESIGKDVLKLTRASLSDKAHVVQVQAAALMEQLSLVFSLIGSHSDLENIKTSLSQTMDSPSKSVRTAAARCLATVLVSLLDNSPESISVVEIQEAETKKKKGKQVVNPDEEDGRSSPIPSKSAAPAPYHINLRELLRQVATLYARTTSRHIRTGLIQSYIFIFKKLPSQLVRANYALILDHFLKEMSPHPLLSDGRYRTLETRRHINYLLGKVIRRQILDEPAKMAALRTIISVLQRKQPSKTGDRDPWPAEATIVALNEIGGLIQDLGSATSIEQESLQELLRNAIRHPHIAVQTSGSWTLRSFILAVPNQIEALLSSCKSDLKELLDSLSETNLAQARGVLGLAQAVAVLVQICPSRPLYFSGDVILEIWTLANSLLQSSAKSDLRVSQIQIQVAWNLIGALMAAGSPFIKSRLTQLSVLWQNALPRPFSKESMATRNLSELQYLLQVKEKALSTLWLFLQYNVKLLTHDISKRILTMLSDTNSFVGSLPPAPIGEDPRTLASHSQMTEIAIKVKMRVMRCYCSLAATQGVGNLSGPELLMSAISVFSDSDPLFSRFSTGKQALGASFESFSLTADNYAWGLSSYVHTLCIPEPSGDKESICTGHWSLWDSDNEILEQMLTEPIVGAIEHDTTHLYCHAGDALDIPQPPPPPTALVDAAIELFSISVFDQPVKIQESAFAQIAACFSSGSFSKHAGRKAAAMNNIGIAISKSLSNPMMSNLKNVVAQIGLVKVMLFDTLKICLVDADPSVRFVSADSIGRLCCSLPDIEISKEIKKLTDAVIANRDPNSRAGFALALGSIMHYMGGMAAGLHLRNVLGLLLTLANDPHPTVHFWALEGLEKTINSAGLAFSSHVPSCLGAISGLILSDGFDSADVSSSLSNIAIDLPTLASLVRCIDAIINALGPDLGTSKKSRTLISTLVNQLERDADDIASIESLRCMQHLSLFVPETVSIAYFTGRLEHNLDSGIPQVRLMSCEAIYELVRKDVRIVFRTATPSLSDKLWVLLNEFGQVSGSVEEIIRSWVEQTALDDVGKWIKICLLFLTRSGQQEILAKDDSKDEVSGAEQSEFVDEAAAFSSQVAQSSENEDPTPTLRWQAISFVLTCLRRVVELNLKVHSAESEGQADPIATSVGDLIRAAFTASTSTITNIRLAGLNLLHDIIKGLAEYADPDFPESTLLEQYQAQIASALTPAFASDSLPEIAAEAISICAEFISSNIVKDMDHMGRLLKILVEGLVNVDDENLIGDLKISSSNARLMVRLAVLSAWAELQIQSTQWTYLVEIVEPRVPVLVFLWLETLKSFAKLQFEPDITDGITLEDVVGSSQFSFVSIEFLLEIYDQFWLQILSAVATLIEFEGDYVYAALDYRAAENEKETTDDTPSNYRDEPVAFFFIIYGLCFQTLIKMVNKSDAQTNRVITTVLRALRRFLRPSISGNAMYKNFVFAETTDLLDRLVLMESPEVQSMVVQITINLARNHPGALQSIGNERQNGESGVAESDTLNDGIEQLLDLVHILILALNQNSPYTSTTNRRLLDAEKSAELVAEALLALIDITEILPHIIKIDLYGGIFRFYDKLLDHQSGFSPYMQLYLASYRRFCRDLRSYIEQNGNAVEKVVCSIAALVFKVISRLATGVSLSSADYEAGCFLATISFTVVPDLWKRQPRLFEQFLGVIISGLESPPHSISAAKCFRALFTSQGELSERFGRLVTAELIASIVITQSNPSSDPIEVPRLVSAMVDVVHHHNPAISNLSLVLPVLSMCCDAEHSTQEVQKAATSALLNLARFSPNAFKRVLSLMAPDETNRIQSALQSVLDVEEESKAEEVSKPTISLKFDLALD